MLALTLCMKNTLSYLYLDCLGHQELENIMGMGLDGVREGRRDRRTDGLLRLLEDLRPTVLKIFETTTFSGQGIT